MLTGADAAALGVLRLAVLMLFRPTKLVKHPHGIYLLLARPDKPLHRIQDVDFGFCLIKANSSLNDCLRFGSSFIFRT